MSTQKSSLAPVASSKRLCFIAAFVGFSGLVMSSSEVRADTCDYTFCTEGSLCLFGDANYAGRCIGIPENSDGALLFTPNIGEFMNDLTTGIWNRTGREICFFRDINYQVFMFCVGPQGYSPNIGPDFNDAISSFQPRPSF